MSVLEARTARTSSGPAIAGIVAGIAGAVIALVQLVVPAEVPAARFSYPFAPAAFTGVQIGLFVHHVAVAATVLAALKAGASGSRGLARTGAGIATTALVALGVTELAAISAAHLTGDSPALEAAYGTETIVMGIGMLLLGIAVVRARRWTGWRRWLVLVMGVYVFVPLTPLAFGDELPRLLALAGWSLLFAVLGATLLTARRR